MAGSLIAPSAVEEAARRLLTASSVGVPCEPVRDLIAPGDIQAAYAVQQHVSQARVAGGARIVGRKIGLTSRAVQQQVGVDTPDFGVLFDDMQFRDGAAIAADVVMQPRAEAEIAFVLAEDLVEGDLDYEQVEAAIEYAVTAVEVCDSRIRDWDISFVDTVADNASSGLYVLGTRRRSFGDFEPRNVMMSMSVDGQEVSTGTGSACLDDPVNAVVWLARQARAFGSPLRHNQVILSGALGPMHPIRAGNVVRATVSELGSVSFSVASES